MHKPTCPTRQVTSRNSEVGAHEELGLYRRDTVIRCAVGPTAVRL